MARNDARQPAAWVSISESEIVVRSRLELIEAEWGGSLRAYSAILNAYAAVLRGLAGSDERVCATCGAVNFTPDGLAHINGTWLSWSDGTAWCGEHWKDGDEYIETIGRQQIAAKQGQP